MREIAEMHVRTEPGRRAGTEERGGPRTVRTCLLYLRLSWWGCLGVALGAWNLQPHAELQQVNQVLMMGAWPLLIPGVPGLRPP